MSESTPAPEPARTCEKCRQERPPSAFTHGVEPYQGICVRCMQAMGYTLGETR